MASTSKEDMEMFCFNWGDVVVTKLNVLELSSVRICRFKEEAHATIAFLISQDFLADILIDEFLALTTLNKFHSVVQNVDLSHIYSFLSKIISIPKTFSISLKSLLMVLSL